MTCGVMAQAGGDLWGRPFGLHRHSMPSVCRPEGSLPLMGEHPPIFHTLSGDLQLARMAFAARSAGTTHVLPASASGARPVALPRRCSIATRAAKRVVLTGAVLRA